MYVLDNSLVYICHPKMGSMSTGQWLDSHGAVQLKGHHYIDDKQLWGHLKNRSPIYATKRNMFEVMVSWWFTLGVSKQSGAPNGEWENFDDFIYWVYKRPPLQWLLMPVYHFGFPWVTDWIPYEHLEKHLRSIVDDHHTEMPWVNKSLRLNHYSKFYSNASREMVEERWATDLELTGYKFQCT
jgi:hypothetical protein